MSPDLAATLPSRLLTGIPAWVPVLLLGLLWAGHRLSRPRLVKPGSQVGMALGLLALSAQGVWSAFGALPVAPLALLAWAGAYGLALVAGARRIAACGGLIAHGGRVQLPGSWLPMVAMLGIFGVKFGLGLAAGLHAAQLADVAWVATASAALGTCSGLLGSRALAALRCAAAARAAAYHPG